MAFNKDNFNENVDYCEFIYHKSIENGIVLSEEDIQCLANMYAFELDSEGLYDDSAVVVDDEILSRVYEDFLFTYKNPKCNVIDYDTEEAMREMKFKYERLANSRGGYAMSEDYDDVSSEDRTEELTLRFKKD